MRKKQFYQNARLAIVVSIVFASIPAVTFIVTTGTPFDLSSGYLVLSYLGKLFGLLGIGFFALNLLLSGRYRLLDLMFEGLDKLYLFHRKIGQIAFLFLTLHVLAVNARNLYISSDFYFSQLFNLEDIPQNIGKLAYFALFVIILLTLYLKSRYELVKRIHKFLGFVLFLGGIHAFLMKTDLANNSILRAVVILIVAAAIVSYTFRTVLEKFFVKRYKGTVVAVEQLSDKVTQVSVELEDKGFDHNPGQFVWVDLLSEKHPFTISSGRGEDKLRFSIKRLGDFTTKIAELESGGKVAVEGAYGGFTNIYDNQDQIWIAGGIGITPFLSMIRSLDLVNGMGKEGDEKDIIDRSIELFYSYKGVEDGVFVNELRSYAEKYDFLTVSTVDTLNEDRFAVGDLFKGVDKSYYICGPEPFVKSIRSELVAKGVSKIHIELFKLF